MSYMKQAAHVRHAGGFLSGIPSVAVTPGIPAQTLPQ
jgi:hypothetical protein